MIDLKKLKLPKIDLKSESLKRIGQGIFHLFLASLLITFMSVIVYVVATLLIPVISAQMFVFMGLSQAKEITLDMLFGIWFLPVLFIILFIAYGLKCLFQYMVSKFLSYVKKRKADEKQ